MEIQDFRIQLEKWPRNRRGRLVLSDAMRDQVRNTYNTAGLSISDFSAAAGLKMVTVVRILKGTKKVLRKARPEKSNLFRSVKMTASQEDVVWTVCGPQGLSVQCKSLVQLSQLWRSLC